MHASVNIHSVILKTMIATHAVLPGHLSNSYWRAIHFVHTQTHILYETTNEFSEQIYYSEIRECIEIVE